MSRDAHLVGSLPGANPLAAMTTALQILGPHLRTLPDGETGERRNWIISIVDGLRSHPDLEVKKNGDWSDYDKTPQMRIRKGRRLYGASLDFGHVDAVNDSFPDFEKLKAEFGRPDLTFQESVPGDFDLAMFTLGPAGALRHRRAFTEATLSEIRGVRKLTGPDTLFQIELPIELVLLAKAPALARPVLAGRLARGVTGLAAAAPEGTKFAVHLCLGDMNNRAFGTMADVSPLVLLANAIIGSWPSDRPLEVLHAPLPPPIIPRRSIPTSMRRSVRYGFPTPPGLPPGSRTRRSRWWTNERSAGSSRITWAARWSISSACGLGGAPRRPGEPFSNARRSCAPTDQWGPACCLRKRARLSACRSDPATRSPPVIWRVGSDVPDAQHGELLITQ